MEVSNVVENNTKIITVTQDSDSEKFEAFFKYKNDILQSVTVVKQVVGASTKTTEFPANDFLQIIEAYDVCKIQYAKRKKSGDEDFVP